MGAFCTLATYVMVLFNFISLGIEFMAGTKQEVSTQAILFDRFVSEQYLMNENNFEISLLSTMDIPESVGRLAMFQVDAYC